MTRSSINSADVAGSSEPGSTPSTATSRWLSGRVRFSEIGSLSRPAARQRERTRCKKCPPRDLRIHDGLQFVSIQASLNMRP